MKIINKILLALSGAILMNSYGLANNPTGITQTTSSVASNCTVSTEDINFGNLILNAARHYTKDTKGSINVLCTKSTNYTIGLVLETQDSNAQRLSQNVTQGNINLPNQQAYVWKHQSVATGSVQNYPIASNHKDLVTVNLTY